jgi:RNA polymerase sigma-70 factor (ECF subfamily)
MMSAASRSMSVVPSAADLRLWVRALASDRDKAAFARLFGYFAPRLVAFLARGGVTRDVAEEIAQETMIAVWRKASLYDSSQSGVATWVFTIARNCRVDRLRREGRLARTEVAAVEEPEVGMSSEDHLLADERDARVRDAVDALPVEQAEVVRLSFFAEKPHAEIARELGIPLGTVKSRARLAMAKIRAAWEAEP